MLRDSVLVQVENEYFEVFRHELEPLDELEALKKKAEAGCSKHESGGCDCGAKRAAPQDSENESEEAGSDNA